MYMAYGWPQVVPLLPGLCAAPSQQIVYLRTLGGRLLVVGPTHLELWSASQHKVRLGKYMRDSESVQSEGENLQAVWSPDSKLVAVITSSYYLHIFKIQVTNQKLLIGGKHHSGPFLTNISLVLSEKLPFSVKNLTMSNSVCDNKHILFGLSNGSLQLVSWKGEFYGSFDIHHHHAGPTQGTKAQFISSENGCLADDVSRMSTSNPSCAIVYLDLSLPLRLLIVVYSVGQVAICSISKKGLKQTDYIKAERWLDSSDAVCAAVASEQQLLAVGCRSGAIQLYDIAEGNVSLLRTVSLYDWGYSIEDTGSVSCIAWSPDNTAFAVGWKCRGLAVWSASGCRLMCTIRQIGISSVSSPIVKPNQDLKYEPLIGGTSLIQWDEYGYRLHAVEERSAERILAFTFGKCCLNRGNSGTTYVRQVIYGDDRIMVVQSEETDELKIVYLNIPVSYISQNWPILHVVASKDGMYLAVAGLHGLILYDIRSKRWRVFGDITQEQMIQCKGLLWLDKIVVVCNYMNSSDT